MCDEAKKEGIELDTSILSKEFQINVVEISAKTKQNLELLLEKIIILFENKFTPKSRFSTPLCEKSLEKRRYTNPSKWAFKKDHHLQKRRKKSY